MGVPSAIILVLITILLPPAGVFLISGCKADFWINICLTLLGYIPGHIHAFYLEYVYYERKERAGESRQVLTPAPGVYSHNINTGGAGAGYGTIPQPTGPVQ